MKKIVCLLFSLLFPLFCLAEGIEKDTIKPMPEGFWGTMTPFYIVVLLLLVVTVVCYIPWRSAIIRKLLVVGIPLGLLIAAFIELQLFSKLGSDNLIWWCDMDKVGFWSALWRLFPFALALALQFHSYFAYQNFIFGPEMMNLPNASISLKPKWKGLWWILAVVVLAGLADKFGLKGNALNLIVGIAFCAVLFVVFGKRNFELFGKTWGAAATFFAIVYVIAFLLVCYAFLIALVKVFWQMLVWATFAAFGIWYTVKFLGKDIEENHRAAEESRRRDEIRRMQENTRNTSL